MRSRRISSPWKGSRSTPSLPQKWDPLLIWYNLFQASWKSNRSLPVGWPAKGRVVFRDYSTRYRPGLELVLRVRSTVFSEQKALPASVDKRGSWPEGGSSRPDGSGQVVPRPGLVQNCRGGRRADLARRRGHRHNWIT